MCELNVKQTIVLTRETLKKEDEMVSIMFAYALKIHVKTTRC